MTSLTMSPRASLGVRYARRRWRPMLAVLATLLLQSGLAILLPWPMKLLVDNVLGGQSLGPPLGALVGSTELSRETLLGLAVGATVVLYLFTWATDLGAAMAGIAFGQRLVYDLASDLFGHLQRMSLQFHRRRPVGDSIRRVTRDADCVSVIIRDGLLPAFVAVLSLIAMLVVMWTLHPILSLVALTVAPLMFLALRALVGPMELRGYEQQEADARTYEIVEQTISSIPTVQAFTREEREDVRFRASTGLALAAAIRATHVQLLFKVLVGLLTAVGTAGVLWLGSLLVLEGQLSLGSILVFVAYLGTLYGYLVTIVYTPATIQGALGSLRRVMEILDARREVDDSLAWMTLGRSRGEIAVEDVTFGYEMGRPVLRGISFTAGPGETVAIVGPTGAGKSTLVSLVPRFFDPWTGRVTIDGHDVREVALRSVREQVALVLQEPFLFPLTIADNIAYGRPEATRAEIEAAARAANAHAFIERLPDGYDTLVGERGATLSGGERQRLSIARALIKDAPILILDEPTSALDAETEQLLLEALERLIAGRTTLIIAHRMSTIRRADRILVLRDGVIVETGSHAELLAADGFYAHLHRIQFGGTVVDDTSASAADAIAPGAPATVQAGRR